MPDDLNPPIDPDRISDQKFSTVRRGADPAEVERYLRRVATEMKSMREREADLRRQLDMIRSAPAPVAPDPIDPSHLTKLLGEETTRVLDAAQAAAAEIRAKAEESVARLLREAREEANEMREEAESLLAVRAEQAEMASAELRERTDAQREAAEIEAARIIEESKREGRALVLEAQQMRKRMLDDLAERREQLREQIEQLQAGRDRLVAAYDLVRESVSSATAELKGAFPSGAELIDDEDDDLVEDGSLPAPAGGGSAGGGIDMVDLLDAPAPGATNPTVSGSASSDDDGSGDDGVTESVTTTATAGGPEQGASSESTSSVTPAVTPKPSPSGPPRSPALPTAQKPVVPKAAAPTTAVTSTPTSSSSTSSAEGSSAKPETPPADPRPPASSVRVVRTSSGKASDVFARLREEGAEEVAQKSNAAASASKSEGGSSADSPSTSKSPASKSPGSRTAGSKDPTSAPTTDSETGDGSSIIDEPIDDDQRLIRRRDEAAASIEASLSRRIKRELSDQQNEMLAALTSVRGNISTHDVLPMPEDHLERYDDISLAALSEASEAGAALVPARGRGTARSSVADLSAQLASSIVMPLRERLERCVTESGGERDDLAQAIRATFREWKGQRVDDQVSMHVLAACNRGLLDRLPKTMKVRWVVAEGDAPSPDCDDNALAGAIDRGAAFPTGHSVPPLYPGCHCIIAPVEG